MNTGSTDVTFGWVIRATPPRSMADEGTDPVAVTRALMEANEEHIRAAHLHFNTVWVEDHFQWDTRPTLEALTSLTWLAARHEGMRFGNIVLGQSYRNPALLAKMSALLQALTGGNFILGIGAGWKEDEYIAYGYLYPSATQRIDELEEAVQIIRAMWTESPASFNGSYYRIQDAECQPQPNPPIPLLIAGGGEKKTLRVVAKHADWWNFNFCDAEEFAHKQQVLAEHCRVVGRDPAEITHTYYGLINVVSDRGKVKQRDDLHQIAGTPDDVTRELEGFIKLGVKHIQLRFDDFPGTEGLELFINKVIPRLQG